MAIQRVVINPEDDRPATRDLPSGGTAPDSPPSPKEVKFHPSRSDSENASLYCVCTATTILEWAGIRVMTDPNFLHAGDHVHLGPGVSSTRRTNPAVDLHDLPRIDLVLLSHYHGDHFDQEVETSLRRDLPIITTPHAQAQLTNKAGDSFTKISALDHFESTMVDIGGSASLGHRRLRVTGMPGKHVPDNSVVESLNAVVNAVSPRT
ncbi:hypothetical protein N8T08_009196 [Aspergillus melleus]|uniref:Uncharacterized protein n=1 Tax=Aspergillus melleus TaxID=138277 RepID=A0ACC3ATW7_9EURO|nr:hypothetical protein N8T08_009196 [Aspergillus melleus]